MKIFSFIYFLLICTFIRAQQREFWLTDISTNQKTIVKDSAAAVQFLDSLAQHNYYFTELKNVKTEGSRTEIFYDKGKNFNEAHISLNAETAKSLNFEEHFYTKNLDSLKLKINEHYSKKGFVFSRVKSKFLGMKNGIPHVEITVAEGVQRKINAVVIRGYEKVPKRFVKNLEREFKGKIYREENLSQITQPLQNHPFILLEKPPQTLFTKDSTNVYIFVQKKKSNSFDGIVGFGNDKSEKFTFNGSLNVNFRNMFNAFETVNIFWQRNPDRGQTFDLETDIPYLLNSNVGLNVNANIFRQDSTYANVKFLPGVYLHLNNRQKAGLRGTFETSAVLDSLYMQGRDLNKKGIGIWYDYTEPTDIELFLHKTKIRAEANLLSTKYLAENKSVQQNSYYLSGESNLHLLGNHYLNLKAESTLLNSKDDFAINELLRFGGWNSMRGFNENTLLADFYYYGTAEYRYLVGNQAFFDVFGQYGSLNNRSLNEKPKLYSFGLGFNFFLPVGLMSFQISNGNQFGNPLKFGDTKIHWGILSRF